ncbi:MAG: thermonuclease family protein [Hyphomicrobiaceae bacterium]
MFGWRRKSDGFEWQKYVRTTIKLRRKERAQKIEDIKQMAASGAKAAGRQSLSASYSGFGKLKRAVVRAWLWLWRALTVAARALTNGLVGGFRGLWQRLRDGSVRGLRLPAIAISARQKIAAMFGGLALLAGLSAYLQFVESGAGWSTLLATLVAVLLIGLAAAPWLKRLGHAVRQGLGQGLTQSRSGLTLPPMKTVGAVAAVVLTAGVGFWAWQSGGLATFSSSVMTALPSLPTVKVKQAKLPDITGRGRAVTGDTLRIGRRLVQLAGIEAPEISQVCRDRRKRAWRCGQSARRALRRVLGRKRVVCSDVTKADGGRFRATCQIGKKDVAAEVVRKGYAFAQGALFKTYAEVEAVARDAKRGVWQGKAQRPADFRAQRWESASKSAPDGCPIKGRVVRRAKVYVLPWALDYRQVRVRSRRGERWFCSEAEATSAGFRPSSTG